MAEEQINQIVADFINRDYSNVTFATRLYDLFCKHDELVKAYIKVGRKFWYYDEEKQCFRRLTVTYVRTGVVFYEYEDEPEVEYADFTGSFRVLMWSVAEIYPNEIGNLLSEYYPESAKDFPNICKQCKWEDYGGAITVKIIWD